MSGELLEDYGDARDAAFQRRDKRIIEYVKARLGEFNPNYQVPAVVPIPHETWVVGTNSLG